MNLNIQNDADKLAILKKYYAKFGDESAAYRVIKNPSQVQAVLNDIQSQIDEQINKASRGVQNSVNFEKEGKAINKETKESLDWVNSLKNTISDYGQFLDTSVVDKYNGLALEASKAGMNAPQLEGGSGKPISMKEITAEATGNASTVAQASSGQSTYVDSRTGRQFTANDDSPVVKDNPYITKVSGTQSKTNALTVDNSGQSTYIDSRTGRTFTANDGSPVVTNNPYVTKVGGAATSQGATTSTTAAGTTNATTSIAMTDALQIIADSDIPDALKTLYSEVVKNWDPDAEIQPDTIIKKFQEIRESTIDPYIGGLANLAIKETTDAMDMLNKLRGVETETEEANTAQDIKNTQADLEARGMTFSGEAINQLGKEGAYADRGNPSQQLQFGMPLPEGLIPKKNRLISTSSAARYKDSINQLGSAAEANLGSEKAAGLVGGYTPAGGVQGDLATKKQTAYGSLLNTLFGQSASNYSQAQDIPYNFNLS